MDPFTLALIIGGGTAAASKLGGASTSDALKQGILSGGLSMLAPGSQASNPFARAFSTAGTESAKQGLKALLIESGKQGLIQRGAKKFGVDPTLAMSAYNIYNTIPGTQPMTGASTQGQDILTQGVDTQFPGMPKPPTTEEILAGIKPGDTVDRSILQQAGDIFRKEPGGQIDIDKVAKGATLFGVPALLYASGAFEPKPQTMYMPTYNVQYPRLRAARGPMQRIDPVTGQQVDVAMQPIPEETREEGAVPYEFAERTFYPKKYNQGGLASIQQFNQGGLSKIPSKISHDENDVNNYMRLNGYIEDQNGNKNEDTLLAQLADGEFVTRTDGVLGAGIIAGANPKDEKEMRAKGAKFFYEQQARFKRIFDLLNENRARKLH